MEMATRGSRCVFFPLSEVASVQIRRRSPSRPIQTGALCGEPSDMSVAKCAKLGRSINFFTSSESGTPIDFISGSGPSYSRSVAVTGSLPAVYDDRAVLHHPLYIVQ